MAVRLYIPGFTPAAPVPEHLIADLGLATSGNLAGSVLPDGVDTTRTWSVPGPGTWARTAQGIKPTAGTATPAIFSAAGAGGGNGLTGRVTAKITALASSNPVVALVARATDVSNHIRLTVQPTTGFFRLASYIAGTANTLYDSTVTGAVGQTFGLKITSASHILIYVNGTIVQDVTATGTLGNANLQAPNWGVLGNFATDPTGTLDDITFDLT